MADTVSWQQLGAQVAAARNVEQLSQAELAAAVDLDRTAITKIEAGVRGVDSLELVRLARALKRPIDWFLSPALPAVVSRRSKGTQKQESRGDALLDAVARDVKLLLELNALSPAAWGTPLSIDSLEAAERAARETRKRLGVPAGAVWDLLAVAERAGLYCFCLHLDEALDGSYLRLGDAAGVAIVNGSVPSGRRRFTLVHELGHHLFADDFSDEWIVGDGEERERLINAFVIHFLLPREIVLERWKTHDGVNQPRFVALVVGAEFGVSWTAVLGHLRNLKLIEGTLHKRLETDGPTRADYLETGITLRDELGGPAVGPSYAQAVIRAYKRHKIGQSRAIDMLRGAVAPSELPRREQVPVESMRSQFEVD